MTDFKEFQGKTLDAAIAEACAYYDAPRERLEIDIMEDAKSGIFGLVGARKARIRARRAQFPALSGRGRSRRAEEFMPPADTDSPQPDTAPGTAEEPRRERRSDKAGRGRRAPEERTVETAPESSAGSSADGTAPVESNPDTPPGEESAAAEAAAPRQARRGRPPRSASRTEGKTENGEEGKDTASPIKAEKSPEKSEDAEGEGGLPRVPLSELDQERLLRVSSDMVSALIYPIVGEVPLDMSVTDDRVQVRVDCEDTGLLIGREGQNLAAVQYLAARMITHAMGAQVRVQVDAGDYHFRQDSRLQELAHNLADKVRATGRPQSTRPLSAYQRRVIHLALQDDPDVQTCSSGEGALKRVVILRRKD
ncbi:MAG: Jag N-terminal domain-containing protein [Desulfovibrionaceae bacterium]|nr:Jag N-terminal domain-containing protein [Desulfovibrionaceae bacterium]